MKRPILRTAPCAVVCRGDGSAIGAIIDVDKWPHGGGVAGFGDTLPDALRSLADEIEKEVDYASPFNLTMLQYLVEELNRVRRTGDLPGQQDMDRIYAILDAH